MPGTTKPYYKRVLLKLSGESLMGPEGAGISKTKLDYFADQIAIITKKAQLAIVIGGGNIFRGAKAQSLGIKSSTGDQMGMLATMMNSLALEDALGARGVPARVQSGIDMDMVAEPFIVKRSISHLTKGRVVIFACGIGRPNFTTDTAAVLRAIDVEADIVLKGTRVNGIYTSDPEHDENAQQFSKLSFRSVISGKYEVMDQTAFTLCNSKNLPIRVFNMDEQDNLVRVVNGDQTVGTLIDPGYTGEPVMFLKVGESAQKTHVAA